VASTRTGTLRGDGFDSHLGARRPNRRPIGDMIYEPETADTGGANNDGVDRRLFNQVVVTTLRVAALTHTYRVGLMAKPA
jgi:hypothetical protein